MNKIQLQLIFIAVNCSCFFFFVFFLYVLLLKKKEMSFCAHINHFTLCPQSDVTCDEQPRPYLTAIKLLFQYDDAAYWGKWNETIQHFNSFLIFLIKLRISLTRHFWSWEIIDVTIFPTRRRCLLRRNYFTVFHSRFFHFKNKILIEYKIRVIENN